MSAAIREAGTQHSWMVGRSQLRFEHLGLLENQHAQWRDALWPRSAGCELGDRKWKITAVHTKGHGRESQEA